MVSAIKKDECRFTNLRVKGRSLNGKLDAFMFMHTKFGRFACRNRFSVICSKGFYVHYAHDIGQGLDWSHLSGCAERSR